MKTVERKIRRKRPNSDGTWAVSYGDMITLLLGFFILFFSLEPQKPKNTVLSESLLATLQDLDQKMDASLETPTAPKIPANEQQQVAPGTNAGRSPSASDSDVSSDQTGDPSQPTGAQRSLTETLQNIIRIMGFSNQSQAAKADASQDEDRQKPSEDSLVQLPALGAEANRLGDRIVIKFPNISFFNSAETALTREGQKVLQKFATSYLPFAGSTIVNIVGFADPRQIPSGKYRFRDNLELSVLRAVSAQRLLEQKGIPLARTKLMGFGVKDQLTIGEMVKTDEERLALSRKIMLIIEPTGERL